VPIVAGIGAIALVAIVAVGASALLGGGSASPSPSAAASSSSVVAALPTASAAPSPTPTPAPTPTPVPTPTPTPLPTPTPTPEGRFAWINSIGISGDAYAVDFSVYHYTPDKTGGYHVHFFWDTIPPKEAGIPADHRNWILYDKPNPFKGYLVADRPKGATKMCILVARADHSVIQKTGNCVDLPSG
jgi:hypothetical protein